MNLRITRPLAPRFGALALAVSALAACTGAPEAAPVQARAAYVAPVREASGDGRAYIGTVRATHRAQLSFPVSGKIIQVQVEPGDVVKQGDVLASMDPVPFAAQQASATGDRVRAQAALEDIQRRVARLDIAAQADALSPGEDTAAKAELAAAAAALRSARAQEQLADWSQNEATLRAPFDGVVAARSIEVGQSVGPGVAAIELDGSGRELMIIVPEGSPLTAGQAVTLGRGAQQVASTVLRVDGRVDAGGARAAYVAAPATATVGATWSVQVTRSGQGPGHLQVPFRAVLASSVPGKGQVLRIGQDGTTTELADVDLGAHHGDWIEVRGAVQRGQRVVIAGARAIAPGTRVKPVEMDQRQVPR